MPLPTNDLQPMASDNAPPPPPAAAPAAADAPPPPPAAATDAGAPPLPPGAAPAAADAPPPPPGAAPAAADAPPPAAAADAGAPPPPPGVADVAPAAAPPPMPSEEDRVEASPGTEVAKTQDSRNPIGAVAASKLATVAAEMGFEGVDVTGFGAFPIVSLQKETFKTHDGFSLGGEFTGYPHGSRKKWIYKNGLPNNDPNEEFFYTYDDEHTITGESIAEKLSEWRGKGWTRYIKSPYVELFIEIDFGELNGVTIAFSIPKTSIARYSGFWANLMARATSELGPGAPTEAVREQIKATRCWFGKGPEVRNVRNPFIPLAFKILGDIPR